MYAELIKYLASALPFNGMAHEIISREKCRNRMNEFRQILLHQLKHSVVPFPNEAN
jgi:hypothetical protein